MKLVPEGAFFSLTYAMHPCPEKPLQIQLLVTETSGKLTGNRNYLAWSCFPQKILPPSDAQEDDMNKAP